MDRHTVHKQAREIIVAFDSVDVDFAGSAGAWGYHGGRDLSRLEADHVVVVEDPNSPPQGAAVDFKDASVRHPFGLSHPVPSQMDARLNLDN